MLCIQRNMAIENKVPAMEYIELEDGNWYWSYDHAGHKMSPKNGTVWKKTNFWASQAHGWLLMQILGNSLLMFLLKLSDKRITITHCFPGSPISQEDKEEVAFQLTTLWTTLALSESGGWWHVFDSHATGLWNALLTFSSPQWGCGKLLLFVDNMACITLCDLYPVCAVLSCPLWNTR